MIQSEKKSLLPWFYIIQVLIGFCNFKISFIVRCKKCGTCTIKNSIHFDQSSISSIVRILPVQNLCFEHKHSLNLALPQLRPVNLFCSLLGET